MPRRIWVAAGPLGETRLLWEIGADGAEVRALRRRLGIDAGYASRLLRSLEAEGWCGQPTAAIGGYGEPR